MEMINLGRATLAVTILAFTSASTSVALEDATDTLPNAKAGECYAKVVTPPTFKTETQKVKKMLLRENPLNDRTWDRDQAEQ